MTKNSIIVLVAIIILGGIGAYLYMGKEDSASPAPETAITPTPSEIGDSVAPPEGEPASPVDKSKTVIGTSKEDRDIVAYHYGDGDTELLFVGGIHGGYSWNTALVAYELMDYLAENPDVIPDTVKVTVVPVLNPDGLAKVVKKEGVFEASDVSGTDADKVAGRFNGNNVDLNRNFDCEWKAQGVWQTRAVSGGDEAFSEPESEALKEYVEKNEPSAAVVWYSAAGGVFASSCGGDILPETRTIMNTFADASKYPWYNAFTAYETSGDMVNWLAKKDIPAISVLLTNRTDSEWNKNKAGVDALLKLYAQ